MIWWIVGLVLLVYLVVGLWVSRRTYVRKKLELMEGLRAWAVLPKHPDPPKDEASEAAGVAFLFWPLQLVVMLVRRWYESPLERRAAQVRALDEEVEEARRRMDAWPAGTFEHSLLKQLYEAALQRRREFR